MDRFTVVFFDFSVAILALATAAKADERADFRAVTLANAVEPAPNSPDELAALAVSVAPESYAETPDAAAGIARLRQYFARTPLPTLHHRLMLLWADTHRAGWLPADQRRQLVAQLLKLQHDARS